MSEYVIVISNILLHINRGINFVKIYQFTKTFKTFLDLIQVKYTSFLLWALLYDSQRIVKYTNYKCIIFFANFGKVLH